MNSKKNYKDKFAQKAEEIQKKVSNSLPVHLMGKSGRKMQKKYQNYKTKYNEIKQREFMQEEFKEADKKRIERNRQQQNEDFYQEVDEAKADFWKCCTNPFG